MGWEVVRKAGYILVDSDLKDGPAVRKSKDFLEKTSKSFARACAKYCDAVGELPFTYRERQIASVFLPALAKVSDAVFTEQPIQRRAKEKSGPGWLDYWVLCGSTTFLIELKHSWFSSRSKQLRVGTSAAWRKAIEQLRRIHKADALGISSTDHVVKVAIMIVPSYQSATDKSKLLNVGREESKETFDSFVKQLSPAPNWSSLWSLSEDLQGPYETEVGWERFPCVTIVAKVDNSMIRTSKT
jgi:hypothetical protein